LNKYEQSIINQILKLSETKEAVKIIDKKVKQDLKEAGELLEHIARQKWREIYESYVPVSYERTGATLSSQAIRLGTIKKVGNMLQLSITYDDNIAYRESDRLGTGRQSEFFDNRANLEADGSFSDVGNNVGHAWVKISEGWIDAPTTTGLNGVTRDFEEGTHYLGAVIEEFENFMKYRKLPITLNVTWKGKKAMPKMD
jgi:hypothetical protein